jgi:hypothetical protein
MIASTATRHLVRRGALLAAVVWLATSAGAIAMDELLVVPDVVQASVDGSFRYVATFVGHDPAGYDIATYGVDGVTNVGEGLVADGFCQAHVDAPVSLDLHLFGRLRDPERDGVIETYFVTCGSADLRATTTIAAAVKVTPVKPTPNPCDTVPRDDAGRLRVLDDASRVPPSCRIGPAIGRARGVVKQVRRARRAFIAATRARELRAEAQRMHAATARLDTAEALIRRFQGAFQDACRAALDAGVATVRTALVCRPAARGAK